MNEQIYYHLIDKNNRIISYGICENQADLNLVISTLHNSELTLQIGEPKKVPYVWEKKFNPFYKFETIRYMGLVDVSDLPQNCEHIGDTYVLKQGRSIYSITEYAIWNGNSFEIIRIDNTNGIF